MIAPSSFWSHSRYEAREETRAKEFAAKQAELVALKQKVQQKLLLLQQREAKVDKDGELAHLKAEEIKRAQAIMESEMATKLRLLKQEVQEEITLEREKGRICVFLVVVGVVLASTRAAGRV